MSHLEESEELELELELELVLDAGGPSSLLITSSATAARSGRSSRSTRSHFALNFGRPRLACAHTCRQQHTLIQVSWWILDTN